LKENGDCAFSAHITKTKINEMNINETKIYIKERLNLVTGVTFVKVVPGHEKVAYNELMQIKGIKDAYHIFGEFDFIVISKVDGLSALNILVDTIRESKNVTATNTILGAEL
jgi:hypothetical protein